MILDVVLLLFIFIMCYFSAKKGFIKSLLEILGLVLAILLAFFISEPIANHIYQSYLHDEIILQCTKQLDVIANSITIEDKLEAVISAMPEYLRVYVNGLDVDISDISMIDIWLQSGEKYAVVQVVDNVISPIVILLFRTPIMFALFFVLSIVFKIVIHNLDKALGRLSSNIVNTIFGMVFGLVKSLMIVTVFSTIMQVIGTVYMYGLVKDFNILLNDSIVFDYIYHANPFI